MKKDDSDTLHSCLVAMLPCHCRPVNHGRMGAEYDFLCFERDK